MPDVTDTIPASLHGAQINAVVVTVPPGVGSAPPTLGRIWPRSN